NSDGRDDIVLAGYSGIEVFLTNQSGGFDHQPSFGPTFALSYTAVVADVTEDGKNDLVLPGPVILPGNGDGTFGTEIHPPDLSGNYGVTVGDFNRDGSPDIVVAGYSYLKLYPGQGGGALGSPSSFFLPGFSGFPFQIAVSDLDADGRLDLVVPTQARHGISIYMNIGPHGDVDGDGCNDGVDPG